MRSFRPNRGLWTETTVVGFAKRPSCATVGGWREIAKDRGERCVRELGRSRRARRPEDVTCTGSRGQLGQVSLRHSHRVRYCKGIARQIRSAIFLPPGGRALQRPTRYPPKKRSHLPRAMDSAELVISVDNWRTRSTQTPPTRPDRIHWTACRVSAELGIRFAPLRGPLRPTFEPSSANSATFVQGG
jgi:hypothetical protein